MKKLFLMFLIGLGAMTVSAQEFNRIPLAWKWIGTDEVAFSYNGTFVDEGAFSVNARSRKRTDGIKAPAKYGMFPIMPEGAVNLTYSPDSTMLAFTRGNDLYVTDIASGVETRLTHDGTDLIMNGYASWVYYEEILGRPSRYKAFWWSPDSRKIGFYRFDNTEVPLFPIYSAFPNPEAAAVQSQSPKVTDLGLGGSLSETRYPKAGQTNPEVRIGIINLDKMVQGQDYPSESVVWSDFDPSLDQYFGIPFWGPDSKEFFIARMPRLQNTLDLYSVNVEDGSRKHIYNETYKTWLNWINPVVFTEKGLYMAREFETGWQQIYFLSYDGKEFRRLTDGTNWSVTVLRVDEKKGDVYFTAKRDATVRHALYKVDAKGVIKALTDPAYNVQSVVFSPDGKYFAASYSNAVTPTRVAVFSTSEGVVSEGHGGDIEPANQRNPMPAPKKGFGLGGYVVADMQGPDYDASRYSLGQLVHMKTRDGFTLPGMILYPKNFDPTKQYPVHVDIYGGPDSPLVNDRWQRPTADHQWYSDNGIIQITVDPRAEGHNGREGLDMIYRQLSRVELEDFRDWADWLMALPYVRDEKIGIEGFSYGGMMTALILFEASDKYHYGIGGAGVYDWLYYDTHYTERYMDTPQANPEGYEIGSIINYVESYPTEYDFTTVPEASGKTPAVEPVMLKLTHGTGDDNVHLQNSLDLINELHKHGKKFEFMIYSDGMHGYRGYQGDHFKKANREFWLKYLKSE